MYIHYSVFPFSSRTLSQNAVLSPVEQNPAVDIGAFNIPMRLAINTAQYGRTFQDRSHMFYLEVRPPTITDQRLFNVHVRGKRGNIVQTYPAVEYDFFPTNLQMKLNSDLVHFQWTGKYNFGYNEMIDLISHLSTELS